MAETSFKVVGRNDVGNSQTHLTLADGKGQFARYALPICPEERIYGVVFHNLDPELTQGTGVAWLSHGSYESVSFDIGRGSVNVPASRFMEMQIEAALRAGVNLATSYD